MKIVILAGGFGTRISEDVHRIPKPMIEIGGHPILWHIMKYYSHFGFNDFIICCGYLANTIKDYFANYYLHGSDVTFDFKNNGRIDILNNLSEPWRVTLVDTGLNTMTGGRVARIQRYVGNESFFLTYGDGVSNVDLYKLRDYHQSAKGVLTLTAIQLGGRFGVLNLDPQNNEVLGFLEKSPEAGGWINAGFMVANPSLFGYIKGDECSLEADVLPVLATEKRLGAFKHYDYWQCMDTPRDKLFLEEQWRTGAAPWKVW
ncbi:MAG: glucose-1-phosphate cytidylyltransferase [Deltaproteobacteria bacterium]|jgi:glucose-1-phosphate cytidylyltransferase|nr:glucose-1-phosphate cytidylyltransferase [Deltaproteobacteria bacterium]